MNTLIGDNGNSVIYVENANGVIFGIVSVTCIIDEDGLAFPEQPLTVLEDNGFLLQQDWDNGTTYIEFTSSNGETSRITFSDSDVVIED